MDTKFVDARGLACPLPVVNTKKAVAELKGEGMVKVLVDNEIAVQNLQKFAAQRGLEASAEKKAEKEYEVLIRTAKGAAQGDQNVTAVSEKLPEEEEKVSEMSAEKAASEPETAQSRELEAAQRMEAVQNTETAQRTETPGIAGEDAVVCTPDIRKKGMVVALSANVMGTGEEKLGKALMKAFLFALTKQDVLPETILCYNSGAYLTCEGSESLEDFKVLEAEGVQIATCGTCLDFYGLKEKLAVGGVTNMYDIVETLENAASVIRP